MMKVILMTATLSLLPALALAGPMVPIVGSAGAGWHLMPTPADPSHLADVNHAPDAGRADHYWAGTSYDRVGGGLTSCGSGALVMGFPCHSGLLSQPGPKLPLNPAIPGKPLYYWGFAPGTGDTLNYNADPNFYFQGPIELNLSVLMHLTAWTEKVEFGWYEAGKPETATPLIGGGPAFDPITVGVGSAFVTLNGDSGLYYKNHARGTAFFTESMFNYLFDVDGSPAFKLYLSGFGLDDEMHLLGHHPWLYQQWAIFGQGNRFWLGLEDIFGPTYPCVGNGPCSDYDYNDFIIGGRVRQQVPEPATLTMLAFGLFGAAVMLRRRKSLD